MKSVFPVSVPMTSVALALALLLGGCSQTPEPPSPPVKAPVNVPPVGPLKALLAVHEEWRGVPYRLGGSNKTGIDCSGFVSVAYRHGMGIHLPRTVAEQQRLGQEIPRGQLQAGDLLFFRTGKWSRHVGIYLGEQRFLHASTREGVKISSLLNPYWATNYWQAKRLKLASLPLLSAQPR
jgi:cell wall-associated NlpC family hydrolase